MTSHYYTTSDAIIILFEVKFKPDLVTNRPNGL